MAEKSNILCKALDRIVSKSPEGMKNPLHFSASITVEGHEKPVGGAAYVDGFLPSDTGGNAAIASAANAELRRVAAQMIRNMAKAKVTGGKATVSTRDVENVI